MTSSLARLTRVYPCPGKLGSVTGTSLATTPRVSQCCPQLQHVRHLSLNSCLHSLHGGRRHLAFPPTQTTVSRPYHCLSGRHRNTHGCHVTDVTRRQLWWTQIPSELRLKWLTLVAKFIATALVLAAVGATQAAFFRDDKKHRKTISLQSSPHVLPMPARAQSLETDQVVKMTGRILPSDYILLGPYCHVKEDDESMFSTPAVAKRLGYQVVVPFQCHETGTIFLLNLGFVLSAHVQRFLITLRKQAERPAKQPMMFVGVMTGGDDDSRYRCWDGVSRSVRELAAGCQGEALLFEVLRGPFGGVGEPIPGAHLSPFYVTRRSIMAWLKRSETPKKVSDVQPRTGEVVVLYRELGIFPMVVMVAFSIVGYLRRGGFSKTFYQQFLLLKEETALAIARQHVAKHSRRQLKG